MRFPSITKTAWSACVWLCAGIELPASIRIIPIIPPVDSTCWSIFIDTPGHPVGDQGRADVSSFVWYMRGFSCGITVRRRITSIGEHELVAVQDHSHRVWQAVLFCVLRYCSQFRFVGASLECQLVEQLYLSWRIYGRFSQALGHVLALANDEAVVEHGEGLEGGDGGFAFGGEL